MHVHTFRGIQRHARAHRRLRRPCQVVCLAVLGFTLLVPTRDARACEANGPDPISLYGDEIRFEVLRNGNAVGAHVTRFLPDGERLQVTSELTIEINFLIFTAYRFEYGSTDLWCGDQLVSLESWRNDNGEKHFVRADRDGEVVRVSNGDRDITAPGDIMPTNHWNAAVLTRDRVLNTLTGGVNTVEITPLGREPVMLADGQTIDAERFRYSGGIQADVWYDADGRWVGLRFEGRDGSEILYRCQTCDRSRVASNAPSAQTPG